MKNLLIILFNLLLFIPFSSNDPIINPPCSSEQIANKPNDCLKLSTNDTYCCYISPLENKENPSLCYPFLKSKYYGYLNINHGQELYSIDCGIGSTFMNDEWELTLDDKYICGTMHPNNYKDCIKASTEENSCCFYEEEDMKGCYWLGIKHKGKVTKNKYTFVCEQRYINNKFSICIYITVFSFFLLF